MTPGAHRPAFRDAPTLRTLDMVRLPAWGRAPVVWMPSGIAEKPSSATLVMEWTHRARTYTPIDA